MGKIKLVNTEGWTNDQWLKYRHRGIGASEVGAVMGLSSYKSSIQLFYEKISPNIPVQIENIFMFMGKEQEAFIADKWQYWEGSEESLIANFRAKKIIRICKEVKGYLHNSDFPQLFVSLDRRIAGVREVLEIKTISGHESDKWIGGIPPQYLVQLQTQLMVADGKSGELCLLKDGRRFDVVRFELIPGVCEAINEVTRDFWIKVLKARKISEQIIIEEARFNLRTVGDLTAELHSLEPPPDGTEAYQDYLKDKFKIDNGLTMSGSPEALAAAIRHRDAADRVKEVNGMKRKEQNYLCRIMGDKTKIDFAEAGYVSWKADENGNRRFHNAIK
jgi:putative phage-type endonuclease